MIKVENLSCHFSELLHLALRYEFMNFDKINHTKAKELNPPMNLAGFSNQLQYFVSLYTSNSRQVTLFIDAVECLN